MDDLISRQAAIEVIDTVFPVEPMQSEYAQGIACGAALARIYVDQLPSAERTGRWTHVYDENEKLFFRNKWVCSACGKSNTYGMSDFCPCCGAMMENSTRRTKEAKNGE